MAQVEIDQRCREFLAKHYGDIQHDDITRFSGRTFRGAWCVAGGPPCQPVSCAGQRRGAEDDRWLWADAIRIVAEVRPAWCLFENPTGLRTLGLDGVLSELESTGYTVGVVDLPACGVGAPHIRHRYWIVGHAEGDGRVEGGQGKPGRGPRQRATDRRSGARDVADASPVRLGETEPRSPGPQRHVTERDEGDMADAAGVRRQAGRSATHSEEKGRQSWAGDTGLPCGFWDASVYVSCADNKLRRAPDDTVGVVDGLHRSVLAALGNSIVPQVASEIFRAMIQAEEGE